LFGGLRSGLLLALAVPVLGQELVDAPGGIVRWFCNRAMTFLLPELTSEAAFCSEATKLDRFWLESSASIPWLGGRSAMKASRFSDAQKAFILKQGADGVPVADICRKAGISQATYFNWKKKYDGLLPTEMRRLKQLEDENSKLRKVVADLSLDKEMLQDALRRKL
jgi:putative transposase